MSTFLRHGSVEADSSRRPPRVGILSILLVIAGCGAEEAPDASTWRIESMGAGIAGSAGEGDSGFEVAVPSPSEAGTEEAEVSHGSENDLDDRNVAAATASVTGAPVTPAAAPAAPAPSKCPRRPAPRRASGSVVILTERSSFCDVVATPVATLRPSQDGTHPDPAGEVRMTTDGRYLTWSRTSVEAWGRDGGFLTTVGQAGDGPGEFNARGITGIFTRANDSIFVLDAAQRWTVIDSNLTYQRTFLGRPTGRDRAAMHLTPRGILTTSWVVGDGTPLAFHLMDRSGGLAGGFGPEASGAGVDARSRDQLSAYDGENGFWVVPANGAARGLTLEFWTLDGEKVVTLERRVPWLPPGGYPPIAASVQEGAQEPALPEYDMLHVDSEGLIWMVVVVRDARWRYLVGPEKAQFMDELYDARLEVIDPAAGEVLVSYRYDGPSQELPPFSRFIPGTSRSYRTAEDALGGRSFEIFDVRLVE